MASTRRGSSGPDVVIIGAGPNGLTAGVVLARAGLSVHVVEATSTIGGGCRSAPLTLPGFTHDICAAVHPIGVLSPGFREIGLERFGLEWVRATRPLAHPLADGSVGVLDRSIAQTAAHLGADGPAWERMLRPFADETFLQSLLRPLWYPPRDAVLTRARFGFAAVRSAKSVARVRFQGETARALFAGCAAHSVMALDRAGTAAFGLVLAAAAHAVDWPCARGGSGAIVTALRDAMTAHGGTIETGRRIRSLRELSEARAILFNTSPRQMAEIAGDALPAGYRARLQRFRHGSGIFKLDWALRVPIPWRNPECREAATVHLGGSFDEILRAEHDAANGRAPERPFVLVAQPSLFDASRAPAGQHTGWAYCHVPNGCPEDMTERIEAQVDRFAPGFRDCILARHRIAPTQLEAHNPAMIGGDMAGGENSLGQFVFRPTLRWHPYTTPNPRIYLCSSSTPPGGGVHGMCGYHAAHAVLRRLR